MRLVIGTASFAWMLQWFWIGCSHLHVFWSSFHAWIQWWTDKFFTLTVMSALHVDLDWRCLSSFGIFEVIKEREIFQTPWHTLWQYLSIISIWFICLNCTWKWLKYWCKWLVKSVHHATLAFLLNFSVIVMWSKWSNLIGWENIKSKAGHKVKYIMIFFIATQKLNLMPLGTYKKCTYWVKYLNNNVGYVVWKNLDETNGNFSIKSDWNCAWKNLHFFTTTWLLFCAGRSGWPSHPFRCKFSNYTVCGKSVHC